MSLVAFVSFGLAYQRRSECFSAESDRQYVVRPAHILYRFLGRCLRIYLLFVLILKLYIRVFASILIRIQIMGNEGSIPSDEESQISDWQSVYSYGSRAGRRSSLGSMRIPSPMDPPEPDLSHLSPAEVAKIREVIGRAKEMKDEEHKRIRKLEEDYISYASDVEKRASEAVASGSGEFRKEAPLCPICLKSELKIQEGRMTDGQNVCVDCGNLTCLDCGSMEAPVTPKVKPELEWVCHVCHKRRQLVLSSGLWHPGFDVAEEVPLAKEIEHRLAELEHQSIARGPLKRSSSLDSPDSGHCSAGPSLPRQLSLPDYKMPQTYGAGHALEVIQESGLSENASPEPPLKTDSPEGSDEMKKSGDSGKSASLRAIGQPSSRSESEYSDGTSDVDMEDMSMMRSGTDGISPDDGSDDYSFMSIGSSDDNMSIHVRRKHRPKSLNLSRSISATSSEDETSDSAISTDVESKYGPMPPPDPHELRIALAASAFVEDMRVADMYNDTDDEIAEITALDEPAENKVSFSPSAPVSPSWREGLQSPPFSPRRRDSYPGKRRGSSPSSASPKDKRFTYNDTSPPSRQLSNEDLRDKETVAASNDYHTSGLQRQNSKSPDEIDDHYYGCSGEVITYDRPTSSLKKSKPFYSLDDATVDLNDTTTVMDLATYAATVASNTANLTSMTISPTNLDVRSEKDHSHGTKTPDSGGSSSPVSPGFYDNVNYPEDQTSEHENDSDMELADPSQKPIDYQGSKRQKVRPPTTDWSPVIDLSPILAVSPSLEEAEQAEMLAQQQEEKQRQASREDLNYSPDHTFVAVGDSQAEVDYMYYGLKRYEVVEDISELIKTNSDTPEASPMCSNGSDETLRKESSDSNSRNGQSASASYNVNSSSIECVSVASVKQSDNTYYTSQSRASQGVSVVESKVKRETKKEDKAASPKGAIPKTDNNSSVQGDPNATQNKNKSRRRLPEPTADIIATQKAPVPKPRKKDKPGEPPPQPPQKPARTMKPDMKEPSRAAPTLPHAVAGAKPPLPPKPSKSVLQKQDSEERRRTAKDMKAKPDPVIVNHLEIEEASAASPPYKVLESPPSPENKAAIRREYSDSTSVSPSSSPDREVYLYPSPVTPPDSDSSPPKPHSPSSGTDFEEEFIFAEVSPKSKHSEGRRHDRDRGSLEKVSSTEKDPHSKSKQHSPQSKEHKQKEMKKIRRKLPPIPSEEEMHSQKSKQRPVPARKPAPRTESKLMRKKAGTSSASDDSSMNEDDKEVASITRKTPKAINNLDKPSLDKRNGNYITSSEKRVLEGYRADDVLKINIPPDMDFSTAKYKDTDNMGRYFDETDEIIDSLINIYGAPITQAMKGLKRRLQDELRRVTEGRRRKIDEFEELRQLKQQLGDLRMNSDKSKSQSKSSSSPSTNGKKRSSSNSRTSPQLINRRARHKRQSSDPMVAKFSPIKEDKDIESEMTIVTMNDDSRSCRTADDSSQSGVSDTDSTRSEPVRTATGLRDNRKPRPSDYAKMFYSKHAQSSELLETHSKQQSNSPHLITSHSEGNLPLDGDDEELRVREEKRRELQFEIEKRKRQLAQRQVQIKESRLGIGATNKQLAHSCDEISSRTCPPTTASAAASASTSASGGSTSAYIPQRPIPTGIIKPIDHEDDSIPYKASYQNQQNYSSTEYLAHKQEELMRQRFDDLSSFSSPFLFSSEVGEKSAFVPQLVKGNLDAYSYSTGNVNISKESAISSSATLPNMPISRADLENNNRPSVSDTEASPPYINTPAMPLLSDVKARSRKIIHEIGSGSRPVSAEFTLGVEDLMNGIYRVESDNSVDADEPIMKHLMEGGVTILKQLERRKQIPPPSKPKKYEFNVKRILLTADTKEKYGKGRPGNSIGMKIIGGKSVPGTSEVGAYVAAIYKGGVADQLHGEVNEGDQIVEWNGIELSGKSYEEVQQIIANPVGEIELVIKPCHGKKKVLGDTTAQAPSCHSSYDNLECEDDAEPPQRRRSSQGVDPQQLADRLEGIEEDASPSLSHSSSQQDCNSDSPSSGESSPVSEPASTSSERTQRRPGSASTVASSGPSTKNVSKNALHGNQNKSDRGLRSSAGDKCRITPLIVTLPPATTESYQTSPPSAGEGRDQCCSPVGPESPSPSPLPEPINRCASPIENKCLELMSVPKKEIIKQTISFEEYLRLSAQNATNTNSNNYDDKRLSQTLPRIHERHHSPSRDRQLSPSRSQDHPCSSSSSSSRSRTLSPSRSHDHPSSSSTSRDRQLSPTRSQDHPPPPSSSRDRNLSPSRSHDHPTSSSSRDHSSNSSRDRQLSPSRSHDHPTSGSSNQERQPSPSRSQVSPSNLRSTQSPSPSKVLERPASASKVNGRQPSPSKGLAKRQPLAVADPKKKNSSESEEDIQKSQRGSSRGDREMGDIQLQLNHSSKTSEFTVRVLQARNLLPKDLNGLSDPFVKIYLLPGRNSENKRRTKHIPRTLNPEWTETCTFPNVHREELSNKTLEVTVWDYDRFKANDFLGEVVLDLSENAFLDNAAHWYPLCDHDEKQGIDLPVATVLPPKCNNSNAVNNGGRSNKANNSGPPPKPMNGSPIRLADGPTSQTTGVRPKDKHASNDVRGDRVRHGMARRRRSFDGLQDVDKV